MAATLVVNAFFYNVKVLSEDSIKKLQSLILDESEKNLHDAFSINVIALFLMAKEFLPAMVKNDHRRIITIANLASYITEIQNVDYACSKVSALVFHEGLTQELRHCYKVLRVRTGIVHPGYIRAPLVAKILDQSKLKAYLLEPEVVIDSIVKQILSGKSGEVFLPGPFCGCGCKKGAASVATRNSSQ
ncbi:hypothetical protein FOCG_00016 [Fusarium oxysporum f. sp. radicis-lycopersici 26381]|nr:hypothetical protein FOCG_00016 [Fusarium oxysporum f. sp. radicis-lycopersici 26381]